MRLLIVDDEKDALSDISEALKPAGYEITTCNDPFCAYELYLSEKFDVVISDVRMPGLTGIELLQKIHEFDPHAIVIIITAYGDLPTAVAAINNHAYSFFGKPVNFEELITVLRNIEERYKSDNYRQVDYNSLREMYDKLTGAYNSLINILLTIKK